MPSRRATAVSAALVAALAAGCGNARTPPPDVVTPGPPLGSVPASYPAQGVRFTAPGGWRLDPGTAPLVATVATGRASVAVWRYPRVEPLPRTKADLERATDALVAAAKVRDPTFTELKRSRFEVDGFPAIAVRGTQTVAGQPRTVRSTHVFGEGAEVVVDAMAPADVFDRVDREVFRPVVRSLQLDRASA